MCVSGNTTLFLGHFPRIREDRKREKVKIRPLFGPFCSKSAKIRPQNCLAAPLFIWPFLTYAAEQSASWQHCGMWRTKMPRQDIASCEDDLLIYSELHSNSVSSSRSSVPHRRWIWLPFTSEASTCHTKNAERLSLAYCNATCKTITKSHILNSFSLHCPAVLGRGTDER